MHLTQIHHALSDIVLWFNNLNAHSWYGFGAFLVSSGLLMAVTQWVKKHHQYKHLEDLAKADVAKVITILAAVLSALTWLVNTSQPFLQFAPKQALSVIGFTTLIYNLSKNKKFVTSFNFLSKWSNGAKQLKAAAATPVETSVESTAPDVSDAGILQ